MTRHSTLLVVASAIAGLVAASPSSSASRLDLTYNDEISGHARILKEGKQAAEEKRDGVSSFTWVPLAASTGALCLDGSSYGYFICQSPGATKWQINIQGV